MMAGKETGMFEVPAGGRRYPRAGNCSSSRSASIRRAPVPCVYPRRLATSILDRRRSRLAENIERVHRSIRLDQFRAFFEPAREGNVATRKSAAVFFVTAQVVKQRLRLTSVAPVPARNLRRGWHDAGDSSWPFTVTDDHARQEQVWDSSPKNSWQQGALPNPPHC